MGWYLARMRGSHRQFKHLIGIVTIVGHSLSDDVAKETLNSIAKQAKIDLILNILWDLCKIGHSLLILVGYFYKL